MTLLIIGCIQACLNRRNDKRKSAFFACAFALQALFFICKICELYHYYITGNHLAEQIYSFIELLIFITVILLFTGMIFSYCGYRPKKNKLFLFVCLMDAVHVALQIAAWFTTVFYYYDEDGVFHRGRYYAVIVLPSIVVLLIALFMIIRHFKKLNVLQRVTYLTVMSMPLLALFIQIQTEVDTLLIFMVALAFIVMFAAYTIEQARMSKRQQEEISRQRADNLLLQMRPHFTYNTLMSIYYLCEQDTEKAQQVILDFSRYLQKKFSALGRESSIPFAEELEHTRAYLAVEKARFEDQLNVEFDTPCTAFDLPPLTLQPIVENAVKHGLDPELPTFNIRVSTRETEHAYVIQVENDCADTGDISFDSPGNALENIRERLKTNCRGKLTFTTHKDKVTVTMTLPKKGRRKA